MQPAKQVETENFGVDCVADREAVDNGEQYFRRIKARKGVVCGVKFGNSYILCGEPAVFLVSTGKGHVGMCGRFGHRPWLVVEDV